MVTWYSWRPGVTHGSCYEIHPAHHELSMRSAATCKASSPWRPGVTDDTCNELH